MVDSKLVISPSSAEIFETKAKMINNALFKRKQNSLGRLEGGGSTPSPSEHDAEYFNAPLNIEDGLILNSSFF